MKRLRFYWQVFQPVLLLKDYSFFLGFSLLAFLSGFTLPSVDFYNFVSRVIFSHTLGIPLIYLLLIVAAFINVILIRSTLTDTYALNKQSLCASLVIFVVFTSLAFTGFWSRVNLEIITPQADTILGFTPISEAKILSPSILSIAITVLFTVSIFGAVYSVAYNSHSKTDYSSIKFRANQVINTIDNAQDFDPKTLTEILKDLVETLKNIIPYEKKPYRQFVEENILEPLELIKEFVEIDVVEKPQLLLELKRNSARIDKFRQLHQTYQKLRFLLTEG